jgi:flagellar protein FliO/FliZ
MKLDATMLQMAGQVLFALILIIGIFYVIIKFLSQKNRFVLFGRAMRNHGGVTVGQGKSLQLIELGHSLYLVGTGDNVQLLDKIEDPDEIAYILSTMHSVPPAGKARAWLDNWLTRIKVRKQEQQEELIDETSEFQDLFLQKMQQVTGRKTIIEEILSEGKVDNDGLSERTKL